MKKRILSLVLSLFLAMSFAACGGNNGAKKADSVSTGENEVSKESGESDAFLEEESKVEPVSIIIGDHSEKIWDGEKYGKVMVEYRFFDMAVSDEDKDKYPKLAENLKKQSEKVKKEAKETVGLLMDSYNAYFESVDPAERQESAIYMEQSAEGTVLRADSNIVSVFTSFYDYQGGAHGMYGSFGDNYDTKTGELLNFSDVVTNEDRFYEIVDEKLKVNPEYRDDYKDFIPLDEYRKGLVGEDTPFVIDNEGVIVIFNPYSLGPYSIGQQIIKVLFSEAPEIFNEKYTKVCDSYVMPLVSNLLYANTVDIGGNGERLPVITDCNYDDDYSDSFDGFSVSLGDGSIDLDYYGEGEIDKYLVKTGENYYFLGFVDGFGDWTNVVTVNLSDMKEVGKEYQTGDLAFFSTDYNDDTVSGNDREISLIRKYAFTNPDRILFSPDLELLGNTRTGKAIYSIDPQTGELFMSGDYIEITSEYSALKAKRDVSCDIVSYEGKTEKVGSVSSGTYLCMLRTDGENWADFQAVDEDKIDLDTSWEYYPLKGEEPIKYDPKKEIIRIYLKPDPESGYYHTINGIIEDELFGGIVYAG